MCDPLHAEFYVYQKRLFSQESPTQSTDESEESHCFITVTRFSIDKPRYLLLKEISSLTGKAISTIRDAMKRLQIIAMKEKRQHVLQSLRRVAGNVIGETAPCIAMIRCLDSAKILQHFDMDSMLVEEVRSLNKSNPEPVNLNWGRGGEGSLTATEASPQTPVQTLTPPNITFIAYEFPNTLPDTTLTPEQTKERYSLPSEMLDARLSMRLREFTQWSAMPINLSRSNAYSQPVQTSTLDGNIACVRAYWGYVLLHHKTPQSGIDLELYQDPGIFIKFLSYIRARGVHTSHVLKHISLARKMLDFLQSGSEEGSPVRSHTLKMDNWLNLLSRQLAAIAPVQSPDSLPCHSNVQSWAMYKISMAMQGIDMDMMTYGHLTRATAIDVQRSIIISLVCGIYFPPLRLSWIKSLSHPRYRQCFDPNCLEGQSCLGNHIKVDRVVGATFEASSQWHFGYTDALRLRLNIIHNKNDRRSSRANYQIGFTLPDCHLTKLLLAHIKEGHKLITLSQPDPIIRLFTSEEGNGFSDATFQHYWSKIMQDASLFDVEYFPPSKGRTIFFTEWSSTYGVSDTDDLEAIASLMGNSSKTLINHYAPQRKRRLAQRMVNERASLACGHFKSAMSREGVTPISAHQSESGPSGLVEAGVDDDEDLLTEDFE